MADSTYHAFSLSGVANICPRVSGLGVVCWLVQALTGLREPADLADGAYGQ